MGRLVEVLPFDAEPREWRAMQYPILPLAVLSPVIGGLSYMEMLSEQIELMLAIAPSCSAIAWCLTFHPIWAKLLDKASPHYA
ncbi:MAG: hypothetical protein JRJ58_23535 [Deltaproteobacteria bacterium]|nr:hypothetical protein [Deltaproteobacteria bacterium]